MSTTTYAPISANAAEPVADDDIFDFLGSPKTEPVSPDEIKVRETGADGMLKVTIEKPDGRSFGREVPVESWTQKAYRDALIKNMRAFLA